MPEPDTAVVGSAVRSVAIAPDSVCHLHLFAVAGKETHAATDGHEVHVTTRMLALLPDDDELSTVVAHLIAHGTLGHIDVMRKRGRVGGILGGMVDLAFATQGVYSAGTYSASMSRIASMTFTRNLEREADHAAMYILARAEQPLTRSAETWRRLEKQRPGTIQYVRAHPTQARWFVWFEEAIAEIEAKRAAGQPLVPVLDPR